MRTCTISNAKIVEGGGGPGTYACLGNPCVHFPRRCRTERLEALALCTWVIYKYKSCEHSHAVCCFSALFLPFGWGGVVTIQLVPASVFLLDLPRRTRRACFDCWRDRASQSCLTWPVSEDGREQSSSCFFLRLLILGCRGVSAPLVSPVSWNQD